MTRSDCIIAARNNATRYGRPTTVVYDPTSREDWEGDHECYNYCPRQAVDIMHGPGLRAGLAKVVCEVKPSKKFTVISFDNDEDQTFWDTIIAPTPDKAKQMIATVRPYAVVIDCLCPEDMQTVSDNVNEMEESTCRETWRELVKEHHR